MKPKILPCSVCGKTAPIYHSKKQLCGYCWKKSRSIDWLANSKSSLPSFIKRTPIKKNTTKTSRKIREDVKFYNELWNENPHYCENCKIYLGEELNKSYISHILSKGAYPKHRHNKENINILCFKCHQKWEFGNKQEMSIYKTNMTVMNKLKCNG